MKQVLKTTVALALTLLLSAQAQAASKPLQCPSLSALSSLQAYLPNNGGSCTDTTLRLDRPWLIEICSDNYADDIANIDAYVGYQTQDLGSLGNYWECIYSVKNEPRSYVLALTPVLPGDKAPLAPAP